jgi:hypothetical protein
MSTLLWNGNFSTAPKNKKHGKEYTLSHVDSLPPFAIKLFMFRSKNIALRCTTRRLPLSQTKKMQYLRLKKGKQTEDYIFTIGNGIK